MKPKEIKQILDLLGAKTRKSFGQHFLIDKKVLEDIVEAADIKKGGAVLEIGPGLGVLTKELLKKGAKVIAVERDKRLAAYLETLNLENLELIQGDATKLEWGKLVSKKWKLISNLPYGITSFALRKALTAKHAPEKIVVLIQKEVAERIMTKTGKQSLLSLMIALNAKSVRRVRRVGRGAFYPAPKVESAVIEIIPVAREEKRKKWGIETEKVMKVAKKGFAHPRKKLISNLKSMNPRMADFFDELGISDKARAEEIKTEDWVKFTKLI